MAINFKFDLMGNPEPPSIVLANRNGNKLGQLDVNVESIDVKDLLETSEFTFTLNKYVDGKLTNLWDKVVDFKLVYCPEWDLWYGIKVELDEATETVKTVFCTQLGQEELSQIMVYNVEINTEADIARDDYKISILYDEDNPDASILHRVMSKAPHYSIAYIDESLKRIQKSFSFDDASICDVFDEIEEEVGCLVVYNSNSDKNGMPKRDVSIYDLLQNCKNPSCKHRGEFADKCPKCGSTDIDYGYGEDTTIFVTSDELATQGISLVTDIDSVKNCFKLEAGDDLMTATVRNCNPNGSDYIWYFSDAVKEDMSKELVEAIESYDSKYKEYYDTHISKLDENLVSKYNALVEKYKEYYNTPSTCINCDYEGEFENECPSCHSGNILTGKSLQSIDAPITGYSALMNAYYNTIDLALYLESGLMPNVEMSDTKAEEQVKLLTASSLSPVAVNVEKIDNVSLATANSAVLSMAKVIIRPTYKVEISTSTLSNDKIWSGQFIVTNYSDETDTATSDTVNVTINNETEDFIKQKIEKALNKENTDDLSISGLFDENKYDYDAFCTELKKYALNPLKSFYDACDACLSILAEQGAGDKNEKLDLYENLYEPYYRRSQAIANEIKLREDEIAVIKGVYDETDEDNKVLITEGLQTNIEDCRKEIQDALNFEECLGENLWLELCSYRREDKYSNSNYVSDGLNNAELFEKALEFVEVAENEIFKSAELQHSISATLNNLLAIPKFKPLIKYFKTGNWIRVRVDDRIFKLRLLEYDFSYSSLESIPVEFSDVTKIKNGTTDVQDIFSQAASIASSYDSVQRQAKKGNVARSTIDQWIVDGLDSADVQIKNNNSEEIILTKNGLLARSYDDITGTYSPEQLKITHNIMAYTDDNWETVRQAIGKHKYNLYNKDENKFVDEIGYGMNADFVVAGVVSGSQIIGGDIYSDNYSVTDATGSYLNLRDGTFSFGGGSLRYENGKLIISSKAADTNLTEVNEEWLKTTSVYAENLQVNSAKIQGKLTASQIDVGDLNADDIIGTTIEGKIIKSSDFIGGSLLIGDKTTNTYAEINTDGKLTCTGADITGAITAISGSFENGVFDNCTINNTCTIKGSLDGVDGTFIGTVKGATIEGGTLLIGNDETGYSAWISDEDGILHAEGAQINGSITSVDGTIGDWNITANGLCKDSTKLLTDDNLVDSSLVYDGYSPIRLAIGATNTKEFVYNAMVSDEGEINQEIDFDEGIIKSISVISCTDNSDGCGFGRFGTQIYEDGTGFLFFAIHEHGAYNGLATLVVNITYIDTSKSEDEYKFRVLEDGSLYANAVKIDGNGVIGGWTLEEYNESTKLLYAKGSDGVSCGMAAVTYPSDPVLWAGYTGTGDHPWNRNSGEIWKDFCKFSLLRDGTLRAKNADIEGTITATSGEIGGWMISSTLQTIRQDYFEFTDDVCTDVKICGMSTTRKPSYQIPSLINYGKYSYPRFYAGCGLLDDGQTYTEVPSTIKSTNFMVLEDGSMYAKALELNSFGSAGGDCCLDLSGIGIEIINDMPLGKDRGTFNVHRSGSYLSNNVQYGIFGINTNHYLHIRAILGGELQGTWSSESEITVDSDANLKYDIYAPTEPYDAFFDSLRPVCYKYNNGTSGRVHTGFIAQDVVSSIEQSGLTTQDVAAVCKLYAGGEDEKWALRYGEFISLNTWQIQKLKKRVAELEEKLKLLQ